MKMDNIQNKNGWGLCLAAFAIFTNDQTRWKEALSYAGIGLLLMIVETVFKTKDLPKLEDGKKDATPVEVKTDKKFETN